MEFSINAVTRRQLFQGAFAVLGTLVGSRVGYAAATARDAENAKALVGRLVEHILQVISSDRDSQGQERRLMAAIESQTDLSLLARMTIGRYWRRATIQQREAFVELFREYLLKSFTLRLKSYAGADMGGAKDHFSIIGARAVGKNDVVVRSRIEPPAGAALQVDWRLRAKNERLFVIDLVVEGVSLLITQRSEFGSVLERIGMDGLITELRTRVARLT
ncbi:MAG: ABC transporter substrate-binding protein [Pseudomonadota bacterium]